MPMNITIPISAIVTSVAAAFLDSGGRNAGTPSETASTPVIAVQPLANAVSSRNVVSGCVPASGGSASSTGAIDPVRYRYRPTISITPIVATKKYVATAKI